MNAINMPIVLNEFIHDEINRLLYSEHGKGLGPYLKSLGNKYIYNRPGITAYSYEGIIRVVAMFHCLAVDDLKKKTRYREILVPRQQCMWFGKRYTKLSLDKLAGEFGQDHATALNAIKVINELIETDRRFAAEIVDIDNRLMNGFKKYNPVECKISTS